MNQSELRQDLLDRLPALRAFALALCKDDSRADDLVQDTVLAAWSRFELFEAGTNLQAWLFTILRNKFYSALRKERYEVDDPHGVYSGNLAEKPAHDGRLQLSDFHDAFKTLPVAQREALVLVGASGFSYEEAAHMCSVSIGTMKSRANRGRKRLVALLQIDKNGALELTDPATDSVVKSNGSSAFK